jgi:hypothetical protein
VATIAVTFKHEDEADGEPIGPVYVYDADDPDGSWTGLIRNADGGLGGWMSLREARSWAEARGYEFYED